VSRLLVYLARLDLPRTILWCYLIWYVVILVRHFDPSPRLWLTSLGLSFIIGFALLLNAGLGRVGAPPINPWQTFRFFLMPFGVSSFSALVKGQGFVLVFSPVWSEVLTCITACAGFLFLRAVTRRLISPGATERASTRGSG
jgi:hypothetical protein